MHILLITRLIINDFFKVPMRYPSREEEVFDLNEVDRVIKAGKITKWDENSHIK